MATTQEDVQARNSKKVNLKPENLDPNNWSINYIPEFNGVRLTIDNISKFTLEEREEAAKFMFNFWKEKGFPYPKFFREDLINDWESVKSMSASELNNSTNGTDLFKHYYPHFYETKNNSKNSKSMVEAFNDDELLLKVCRNRMGATFIYRGEHFAFNQHANQLRQGFRSTRIAATTSIFKTITAKFVYENLAPQDGIVYDCSMGFGQRMMGALSSKKNLTYIGCDPWHKQISSAKDLLSFLKEIDQDYSSRTYFEQIGSELFCPEEYQNKVDVLFSSIPYVDTEIYCKDTTQAYYNRSYEDFVNIWWDQTVKNASKLIKTNGYFALNMFEKYKKFEILKDMKKVIENNGFAYSHEYKMKLTKSHLTGKVGKENKEDLTKFEPIVVFKRI